MTDELYQELIAQARRASLAAPAPFRVLCADPPWKFGDKLPGKRGAMYKYPTLTLEQIKRFPLPAIDDDALCFMWRVASMQQEALDVMRAWRFQIKSEIVWRKQTKNGKRHIGMGRTVRGEHETCLIGWRGRPEILDKSIRSTFEAPVPHDEKTGKPIHSAKPECFYTDIVQRLSAGPYVELFSRRTRAGWLMIGNEVGILDA